MRFSDKPRACTKTILLIASIERTFGKYSGTFKIQNRLGHSDPKIKFKHYAHMMPTKMMKWYFPQSPSEVPLTKCEQVPEVDQNPSVKTK